jgi:DNA-binding Lrp family transcriptional regulator
LINKIGQIEGQNLQAYVLINAEPGMIWEVAEATLKIEGVKRAHAVTGQFDTVVYAEFPKMEDLGIIIRKIQELKGVHRTQTLITIPPTIRK